MLSRTVVLALVVASTVPALGKAPEKASYAVTELPGVNPGDGITFVRDMNNSGTVVGGSSRAQFGSNDEFRIRPVKWSEQGVLTELPVISTEGINGGARGINASGRIVGISHVPGLDELSAHAVVFTNDPPTDLGALPGDDVSFANRVNNAGTVVGFSGPSFFFFGTNTAVKWDKKGAIEDLGRLPDDIDSEAHGINESGLIVGVSGDLNFFEDGFVSAVYWDKKGIHELPGRVGDIYTIANAVNNSGVVVGATAGPDEAGDLFPFVVATLPVRWVKGVIETLPLLPGDTAGSAFAVNASGMIVGESSLMDEFGFPLESHPVVWIDGQVFDLNALDVDTAGWEFTRVSAVNDRGQIAGTGRHDGIDAGFLATPLGGKKN